MGRKMKVYEHIENNKAVLDVFGYWPSFHDGEIHKLVLDRTKRTDSGDFIPCIELIIHGWEMTSEVDEKGYYKLHKHHLIHFLFEDVYDVELNDFNLQNVISELEFEVLPKNDKGETPLNVILDPCYGLNGSFKTLRAKVLSVTPYTAKS